MIKSDDIELVLVCGACPEAYDAYHDGKEVAYLRLRHGIFTVECPWMDPIVYSAHPEGDGIFATSEREYYLQKAKEAIAEELNKTYE